MLLAVLVAAGLLALAPALVRRYDATERLDAERTSSTARVLDRRRRRRTVPGAFPVNPPSSAFVAPAGSVADATVAEPAPSAAAMKPEVAGGRDQLSRTNRVRTGNPAAERRWWQRRHRRVFATLVALCVLEAVGVAVVGPGFLAGLTVSGLLLGWYVAALRRRVVVQRRELIRWRMVAAERRAVAAAERRRLAEKRRRIAEARRHAQALARRRAVELAALRAEHVRRDLEDAGPGTPGLRGQSYQARAANF